ncbi:MAG: cytochrome ubiquinol oxidase subunit I [Sinobacteraceae bacterium]|nr:cytochrome ubiquinol oxidase subunit I [Nevskiaceae bacterium]
MLNLLATFVALEVSEAVLVRNQSNGVYPADGDSIGIPLMGIMFYGILSLAFLLFAMGLVRRGVVVRWLSYVLLVLIALGYLVQIADWADALHYPIGLAQAGLGIPILGYLYLEIRRHRIKTRSTQNV